MKESLSVWRRAGRFILVVLSLIPTPMLLFLSSASALYRANQDLLELQPSALRPFVTLFLSTLIAGALLHRLKSRRPARIALWIYYLIGGYFLLFSAARGDDGPLALAITSAVLFGAAIVLDRMTRIEGITLPGAAFGAALLVFEPYVFYADLAPVESVPKATDLPRPHPNLPNIYHVILDEFQSDFFDLLRTTERDEGLAGFIYYPKTLAQYHWTNMSLPSLFTGKTFRYDRSLEDFQREAFDGSASLLFKLKSQGYLTLGYVPSGAFGVQSIYTPEGRSRFRLFDRLTFHQDHAREDLAQMNAETLWSLWMTSVVPRTLRAALPNGAGSLDPEDLDLLMKRQFLPYSAPVISREGFESVIREEKRLPPKGRYTFVHVVIPHEPHKLFADCSYQKGSAKTGPLEQSACALKLLDEYLLELKRLGRFDDSLILVHSDHGGNYELRAEGLKRSAARSLRALLLVKPVGRTASVRLEVSDGATKLLGLGPLLFASLGRETRFVPAVESESLASADGLLGELGFRLRHVFLTHATRFPNGSVVSQWPPASSEAGRSEVVDVLVSAGPARGDNLVPDFIGQPLAEAYPRVVEWARRERAPVDVRFVERTGVGSGMVVRQSPRIGTPVDCKKGVVLYVSHRS